MGKKEKEEVEYFDTMTLTLDDGSELECMVVERFEVEKKEYIALLPLDKNGEVSEEADVYLYRFTQLEGDDVALDNIESDEEFEAVCDRYDELMDEKEFQELFD